MASADISMPAEQGTPEQLPQGAATALNEAAPTTSVTEPAPVADAAAAAEPTVEPQMASPADYEPMYQPDTEEDQFLTGPTMRPEEPQYVGTTPPRGLPPRVRRSLPVLQQLAADPDASPELQALVNLLVYEASQ